MKNLVVRMLAFAFFAAMSFATDAKEYSVSSPGGKINVSIAVDDEIKWSARVGEQSIFRGNKISMEVVDEVFGKSAKVSSAMASSVYEIVTPIVAVKSSTIENSYNQLRLKFKKGFAVTFRVFDNGIAYRFETARKGEITVENEQVELVFADDYPILFPEEESLMSHYERLYVDQKLSSFEAGRFCSLPTLVKANSNIKIGITEADLFDYPGLFLEATGEAVLKSKFPKVILESEQVRDRSIAIKKEAEYIAVTEGTRNFPWRVFMISENDTELVENQLVYLLSRENKIEDTSWIKPGLVAWDWWNDNNIYGVDFKSGIDNQTYKYYIDFASEYGIPYIILDEGWSKTTTNILESNQDIDIKELVDYGKTKSVDLILWGLWCPLDKDMDKILDQFAEWGVKGLKVDFMQRADQYMVNFYERLASGCAERKLLVNYHGAYKPAGLRRAYPNVLNYEGVKGMENCKWSDVITPEHDVTIPFTRMLAGPMDFTPGAMRNANKIDYSSSFSNPMSMGTRCHQLAMYLVYDAPMQMLADSPTNYYQEDECTRFLSKLKTVWDETKVLDAEVGDYIVTARRSGQDWYIGALTDIDPRTVEVDLIFLDGGDYEMEIMQDGINTEKIATDYTRTVRTVKQNSTITIPMAPGGGWAAICRKIDK